MRGILTVIILPLTLAAILFPCLAGMRVFSGFDFASLWYPYLANATAAFRHDGAVPLWMPWIFGGLPGEESMVPSLYYPTDIIGWLLGIPPPLFYAWDSWFHISLSGIGLFALARALGVGPSAALFGGLAFMLSGYHAAVLRAGTLVFIRAVGIYPWMFLALVRALKHPAIFRWTVLAAITALLPLTAAYQPFAYACVLLPLATLLLAPGQRGRAVAGTLGALAGAGILSALTVLPALRYYLLSMRSNTASALLMREMDPYPLNLLSLFIPASDPNSKVKYLGFVTAVLAVAGCWRTWRKGWPWVVVAVVALLFAMGLQTPVGKALNLFPLLGSFRGASHWVVFVSLALGILSAFGFEALLGRLGVRLLLPALILLGGLNAADLIRQGKPLLYAIPSSQFSAFYPNTDPVALFLTKQKGDFRTATFESHTLPNIRSMVGLEWISGYHGAPLATFQTYYDASTGGCPELPWLFSWLNARYFVVQRPQQNPRLAPLVRVNTISSGPVWICENPAVLPRAFFARKAAPAPSLETVMQHVCSNPPQEKMVYIHAVGGFPVGKLASGRVLSLKRSPNRIEAEVESAGNGLVFFSEAFYPAWTAMVDGKRERILRANVMFRAIPVEKGRHRVVMTYESLPFKLGLLISLMTWTALGLLSLPALRRD